MVKVFVPRDILEAVVKYLETGYIDEKNGDKIYEGFIPLAKERLMHSHDLCANCRGAESICSKTAECNFEKK